MKKLISLICVLAMVLALAACGSSAPAAATEAPAEDVSADKTFVVGICQLVQHPALDAATQGFKDALTEALGDKVTFQEQNASGDSATCSLICNQFVSDEVDLIMANATASIPTTAWRSVLTTGPAFPAPTSPALPTSLRSTVRPR